MTFLRIPGVRSITGDHSYAYCQERGVAYEYNPAAGTVVVAGPDEAQVKLDVTRIARILLTNELARQGWVIIHAACVADASDGTLILGDKGAGKTTTSLTLASRNGQSLLANDRCLIRAENGAGPRPALARIDIHWLWRRRQGTEVRADARSADKLVRRSGRIRDRYLAGLLSRRFRGGAGAAHPDHARPSRVLAACPVRAVERLCRSRSAWTSMTTERCWPGWPAERPGLRR